MFADLTFEEKKKKLLLIFEVLKETLPESKKDFEQYSFIVENYQDTENQGILLELYTMVQSMVQNTKKEKQEEIYNKIQAIHQKELQEDEENPDYLLEEIFMS